LPADNLDQRGFRLEWVTWGAATAAPAMPRHLGGIDPSETHARAAGALQRVAVNHVGSVADEIGWQNWHLRALRRR